jgi:menaquinone-dependent protoporphyrinogen IX oxidase
VLKNFSRYRGPLLRRPETPTNLSLAGYAAALLVAPVHTGMHEREMVEFVKPHRPELEAMRSIFISVSLSEAGAEDFARSPEARVMCSA